MNDEIKEILDKWKCYIGLTKKFSNNDMELLRVEDIEKVLDYITNLQQENERLKENNSDMQEEMARTWQKCDDYKSRCEKAIEYINKLKTYPYLEKYYTGELLNILQNGSDNNE